MKTTCIKSAIIQMSALECKVFFTYKYGVNLELGDEMRQVRQKLKSILNCKSAEKLTLIFFEITAAFCFLIDIYLLSTQTN